jgi:ribonuclease HII
MKERYGNVCAYDSTVVNGCLCRTLSLAGLSLRQVEHVDDSKALRRAARETFQHKIKQDACPRLPAGLRPISVQQESHISCSNVRALCVGLLALTAQT